ncbi:hypothetical protein [Streptomyces sp. RB17]|uniref:hypothetical protein n=1 Tax=Streptomyces sp. RB17 TaxID=2585197 RepID=UPI001298230F|nr:hypothetical protein [Streptomyces sp. RB17]
MDLGRGADPQGVALAASHGHALVERGALGGLQFGRAEEVGDPARHVEDDRHFRGRGVRVGGGVLGHEVGDGGTDGAAADVVVAGQGGDGLAAQVRGAHGGSLRCRDSRAAALVRQLLGQVPGTVQRCQHSAFAERWSHSNGWGLHPLLP